MKKFLIICISIIVVLLLAMAVYYFMGLHSIPQNNEPSIAYTNNFNSVNTNKAEITKVEKMYQTIIDDLMNTDTALSSDAKYLALDLNSFVGLDKNALPESTKNNLLDYCKKYNTDVKYASFADLKAQGLFNEKTISLEGVLIYTTKVDVVSENKVVISAVKYRSGLGAIFPTYEAKYTNGEWKLETTAFAIS